MLECLIDGEISSLVNAADRGLNYGDGVFETLPVHSGRPRRWQSHMDRLGAACERLNLKVSKMAALCSETWEQDGRSHC